tara:strand:- start:186 stop:380 length:195 start_codon:yes stop_codon:yes gene_type:complete
MTYMPNTKLFCDNCGETVSINNKQVKNHNWYTQYPFDFESGCKGESAVICKECHNIKNVAYAKH